MKSELILSVVKRSDSLVSGNRVIKLSYLTSKGNKNQKHFELTIVVNNMHDACVNYGTKENLRKENRT